MTTSPQPSATEEHTLLFSPSPLRKTLAGLALLFVAFLSPATAQQSESWIDSPEAYFATRAEREEWGKLGPAAERDAFKSRYWLRRDPSQATFRNEFRDLIVARIREADARFALGELAGSRTARGKVFVVFGTPARTNEGYAARPGAPPPAGAAPSRAPVGLVEGNEVIHLWLYDRERTPLLLKALGRPSLEVQLVLEPSRQRDRLQNPGLFNRYQEILAEKSIVNPGLTRPAEPETAAGDTIPLLALAPAEPVSRERLASVQAAPDRAYRANAVTIWTTKAEPETLVWIRADSSDSRIPLAVEATFQPSSGGAVRAAATLRAAEGFVTTALATVYAFRVQIPPGRYEIVYRVRSGNREAEFAATHIVPADKASSLVLTGGPSTAADQVALRFGSLGIAPRADGTFLVGESPWFFVVLHGQQGESIPLETRLHGASGRIASSGKFDAQATPVGNGLSLVGYEVPLGTVGEGSYSLYVTGGEGAEEWVRRADFKLIAR